MINLTTAVRLFCTLTVVSLLAAAPAWADSVLNFTPRGASRIAVTNPANGAAVVRFTLIAPDGTVVGSVPNPVSYRVPARGQLVMSPREIFPSSTPLPEGWIQATSSTSGLQGVAFFGNLERTLEIQSAAVALTDQIVPHVRPGAELILTNPGSEVAEAVVTFHSGAGIQTAPADRLILGARAQIAIVVPGGAASARIRSSGSILTAGAMATPESLMLVAGQSPDGPSTLRVIPHFDAAASRLILTNPGVGPVTVDATFFLEDPPGALSQRITVPPSGSVASGWAVASSGWIQITSASPAALNILTIVDSGEASTAIPAPSGPTDRMAFLWTDGEGFPQRFSTVSQMETTLFFSLIRQDGATLAEHALALAPATRTTAALRDIFPEGQNVQGGYVVVRSDLAVYATEFVDEGVRAISAMVPMQPLAAGFVPAGPSSAPVLVRVEPVIEVAPGVMRIRVVALDPSADVSLVIGQQVFPMTLDVTPFSTTHYVDIPQLEAGFLAVRIRTGSVDSNAVAIAVRPQASGLTETLSGRAFYQKVAVTDSGLQTSQASMVPIRNARVEVIDRTTQAVLSVSETDERGLFQVAVPINPGLTIRVVSRLRSHNLRVSDNTQGNVLYAISKDVDMRDPEATRTPIELIDTTRISGAFNILDVMQRGNDLVRGADATFVPPELTIFWNERNTNSTGNVRDGLVGTTFFDLASRTAYVLGDRNSDSDEFDDSVLLHEYAHLLADRFSRDDSPGGPHGLGDLLDPRVAWSEAWANFFSAAALDSSIYRDSRGPGGLLGMRYDLEDNVPPGDRPGYRSEASVQSLLWDLIDENADPGDTAMFPFASVWVAFTDLQNDRFVYLPYFLDRFLARNPEFSDSLRIMGQMRSIDFQPGANPSITNPFPRPIQIGESVTGEVDSFSTRRANLAQSTHFFAFTIPVTASVTVSLQVTGLGPANTPSFNDLDLFLLDSNGVRLHQSDRGLNGQSELIPSARLAAGTYIVEIRSFYTRAETNTPVFNSGSYRLTLQAAQ